jgi:hypothetical protein
MKKIGIITLTRQNSLAYSVLRRIVEDLGYEAVCGETVGADSLYFSFEDLTLVGYDFLGNLFKEVGFSDVEALLISAPYSVNLFILPKVVWCLRSITSAPIIIGGNEPSNNYKNIMQYRFSTFANRVVDVAPDFIVRGAAERALPALLPLLDRSTMSNAWDRAFLEKLFHIPNMVFWLPGKRALISTPFSSEDLREREIFTYVKYGEKTVALTLQRACIWAKKSRGGCLFCAIASQFGDDFHCAVESDFFLDELSKMLKKEPEIKQIDIWDDTFNINEDWVMTICDALSVLNRRVGRELVYSVFLRPKGLTEKIVKKMREINIKVAFIGADALTEDLSKRLRRGSTVSEVNSSIETLSKGGILPRLSVQLFSPESSVDDCGITCTVALPSIKNGESTVHVHLYTFPLFGSDVYRLLEARNNLKRIPTPLLKPGDGGFEPYPMAYDYVNYDPDVEVIKQKTYGLLGMTTSFFVKTYPSDHVDGKRLKEILKEVRNWCIQAKKSHKIKSLWFMLILLLEERENGLSKDEMLTLLSGKAPATQIPKRLRGVYGNFGYLYTLSRSFDEVTDILIKNRWILARRDKRYHLTPEGLKRLKKLTQKDASGSYRIAAYGDVARLDILRIIEDKIKAPSSESPVLS